MLLNWLNAWFNTLNSSTVFKWIIVGCLMIIVMSLFLMHLLAHDPEEDPPPPHHTFPPAPWQPWPPGIDLDREQQAREDRERQARLKDERDAANAAPAAPPAPGVAATRAPPAGASAEPPATEPDAWLRDQAHPAPPQPPPPPAPPGPPRTRAAETVIRRPGTPVPRTAPTSGGRKAQALACAEAYHAIMQGRITDLEEIRAVIAEFRRIQATPGERRALGSLVESALDNLEQLARAREAEAAAGSPTPAAEPPVATEERAIGWEDDEDLSIAPAEEKIIRKVDLAFFGDLDPRDLDWWQDAEPAAESAPPPAKAAPSSVPTPLEEERAARPVTPLASTLAQREAPIAPVQSKAPGAPGTTTSELAAAPLPPAEPTAAAAATVTPPTTTSAPLRIQGFGQAQLLVFGASLGTRKTTQLELALALAQHTAAERGDTTFLFRQAIADALWPSQDRADGRNLLDPCKSRLAGNLRKAGLEEVAWLDQAADQNTLRLSPAVETDLAEFMRLTRQIEQHKPGQGWPPETTGQEVAATLGRLKHLYQGGFALQFEQEPWIIKARRSYRSLYYAACFELARRFAAHQRVRHAIDLGTEVLLEANPSGDLFMRDVCAWLASEDPAGRERWAREFAHDYRRLTGKPLAQARPGWEQLRLGLLPRR